MKGKINKNKHISLYYKTFIYFFKIIIFISNINFSLLSNCIDINYPIKRENSDCSNGYCELYEYESGICTIENDIIKTQWFTNIIQFTDEGYRYTLITTTENGDLIVSSNRDSEPFTLKYYYGLKRNGRPYFSINGDESPITTTDSDNKRSEGNIFGIKLKDNNDKEYIIGFGIERANFEVYDFENNNTVYKQPGSTFFNTDFNYFHKAAILKLESEDNYYIIGIIEKIRTNSTFFFHIMKLQFTSLDINSYSPILIKKTFTCYNSRIVSCFETKSKNIICFYRDESNNYVISVFDQELNNIKLSILYECTYTSEYLYYKCIHFIEDSGIFFYYESLNNPVLVFKKYSSGDIINHFTSINEIKIYSDSYDTYVKYNNFIKINNKKFCIINTHTDKDRLFAIIIKIENENIKLRYYRFLCHQLFYYQFRNQLSASIYNGLIAIGSSGIIGQNSDIDYGAIIILSYPNSTDFDVDISKNLEENKNALINLNQNLTIENNLFGYIFYGIKIINYSDGLNLISSKNNNNKINKEDILIDEEEIELVISKEQNIPENSRIEYALVITEPDYNFVNKNYTYRYEEYCNTDCSNEEKEYFVGRTSYCNIIISTETMTDDCIKNCALCLKNDINFCITCKYYYDLSDDGKEKICLDKDVLPKNENSNSNHNNEKLEKYCTENEIIENKCQNNTIQIKQIENIKQKIIKSNNTNNIVIYTKNVDIQYCKTDYQKYDYNSNLSNIDLGECEDKLKSIYKIPKEESLLIFKADIKVIDYLTTYVEYEVYHPLTLVPLNLTYCENIKININIPVKIDNTIEIYYDSLSEYGYI